MSLPRPRQQDFATGLGPYLLTADELPQPEGLKMTLKVNGEIWSEGDSSGRYWSFPLMLSHVSQEEWLYPGDLLGSGTYFKGCGLDLDRWSSPAIRLSCPSISSATKTPSARPERNDGLQNQRPA